MIALGDVQCRTPRLSPDGRQLAFVAEEERKSGVYVGLLSERSFERIAAEGDLRDPAWSPDGKRLAVSMRRESGWGLATLAPDGKGLSWVTEGEEDRYPAWSPNGKRLAFARSAGGTRDLYVLSSAGGEPTRLTDGASDDVQPAWSPDGQTLAFATDREGTWRVYLVSPDGSEQRRAADVVAEEPTWSPDGKRLAYVGTPDPRSARGPLPAGLCVLDLTSGEVARVKAGSGGHSPNWLPNGANLLFARNFALLLTTLDGHTPTPLE